MKNGFGCGCGPENLGFKHAVAILIRKRMMFRQIWRYPIFKQAHVQLGSDHGSNTKIQIRPTSSDHPEPSGNIKGKVGDSTSPAQIGDSNVSC